MKWTIAVVLVSTFVVIASPWAKTVPEDKSGGAFLGSESQGRTEKPFSITTVAYDLQDPRRDTYPMAVPNLMRYLGKHSKLRVQLYPVRLKLTDPELFQAPFIYITGYDCQMKLSDAEIANLGKYLRNGGFLFTDDIAPNLDTRGNLGGNSPNHQRGLKGTVFDQQMRAILKKALGPEARFFRIPKTHALFHSFYDFGDGPPLGGATGGNVTDLEGIEIGGRLAVVFSDLNLSWYWGEKNLPGQERGLQFGVNLIAYALTQQGGIAHIGDYMKREE